MSEKIKITFPDGNTRSVDKGTVGQSFAESISKSLAIEAKSLSSDETIESLCPLAASSSVTALPKPADAPITKHFIWLTFDSGMTHRCCR